ncbi:MAG: peptidyl-prolyl cis-trans isomerase [Planctomycetes bacterium]|nr:peptidyl-prolyl cis-trans isomerase [Planctomycetota bacterium]
MRLLAGMLALIACLWALAAHGAEEPAEREGTTFESTLAVVNGRAITRSRVEHRIALLRNNPAFKDTQVSVQRALQMEIDRVLIVQEAEREFPEAARQRLRALAEKHSAGSADPRKPALSAQRVNVDSLYEDYLIQTYIQTKINNAINVTPQEIKSHYKTNIEAYRIPESVTIRQVLVRLENRTPEQAKSIAETAAKRLESGEDFADVARDLSEGPYTSSGGLWPLQKPGAFITDVKKTALSLAVGQTSAPFESPLGWHIVRVEEHTAAAMRPFNEVQGKIRSNLFALKRKQAETALVTRLRVNAVITFPDG